MEASHIQIARASALPQQEFGTRIDYSLTPQPLKLNRTSRIVFSAMMGLRFLLASMDGSLLPHVLNY
eukprot:10997827-Karenia_brevis.AAC.1